MEVALRALLDSERLPAHVELDRRLWQESRTVHILPRSWLDALVRRLCHRSVRRAAIFQLLYFFRALGVAILTHVNVLIVTETHFTL